MALLVLNQLPLLVNFRRVLTAVVLALVLAQTVPLQRQDRKIPTELLSLPGSSPQPLSWFLSVSRWVFSSSDAGGVLRLHCQRNRHLLSRVPPIHQPHFTLATATLQIPLFTGP